MKTRNIIKERGPHHGTWCGLEAFAWEYLLSHKRTGERFTAMYWVKDRVLEVRFCDGDGRTADWSVYRYKIAHHVLSLESAERIARRYADEILVEVNAAYAKEATNVG